MANIIKVQTTATLTGDALATMQAEYRNAVSAVTRIISGGDTLAGFIRQGLELLKAAGISPSNVKRGTFGLTEFMTAVLSPAGIDSTLRAVLNASKPKDGCPPSDDWKRRNVMAQALSTIQAEGDDVRKRTPDERALAAFRSIVKLWNDGEQDAVLRAATASGFRLSPLVQGLPAPAPEPEPEQAVS